MFRKIWNLIGLLFLVVLAVPGCEDGSTGPVEEPALEFVSFSTREAISMFNLLEMDAINLQSYFLIEWTSQVEFDNGTKSPFVRAFARAFGPDQQGNFLFRGVNMGQVSFKHFISDTVNSSLSLQSRFSPASGVTYGATVPNFMAFDLIPQDAYQVERTGTLGFGPLTMDLAVPSSIISITEATLNTTIGLNPTLRIAWQGGAINQRILLTLQPVFRSSNSTGVLSGIVNLLDRNAGEFTLSEQDLGAFIEHASDELTQEVDSDAIFAGIFVYVAQPVISEFTSTAGRSIAIAIASDQVFFPLNLYQ